jgi:D-serine deaminase-like pyridoxal phosphate-dependent protein
MRIEDLDTPSLIVDLDALERNLTRMADYSKAHRIALRPHTKTHKIVQIAQRQVELGSQGLTVAKTGEAEVMVAAGLRDIFVAYPVYGDQKLDRLAHLAGEASITVAVDDAATVEVMSRAAAKAGTNFKVLVEQNVGANRCGVTTSDEVVALAQQIDRAPGLQFAGLMIYPGHIWDLPADQGPAVAAVEAIAQETLTKLNAAGLPATVVSGGGTPTALNSHLMPSLTEIRPGTYVFNDRNTLGVGACVLDDCALRVQVTVVSRAVPGRAIIDGGSKTFTSDRWISGPGGHGLIVEHPLAEFETMSEEHGHIRLAESGWEPKVGERVTVVPNHVCPCLNLHETIYYHRNGVVEGEWRVSARGRVQ